MVNRLCQLLVALAWAAGSQLVWAQASSSFHRPALAPTLVGGIESTGGQLRLSLANTDELDGFQGTAQLSLGTATQQTQVARLALTLAPRETRLVPLDAPAIPGNQYVLRIYNSAGTLVFYKIASISQLSSAASARPTAAPGSSGTREVEVRARLAGGPGDGLASSGEIELKLPSEETPLILAFDVAAPQPITNASFSVEAKGLTQRKTVTILDRASLEFPLPAKLDARKIGYTLIDAAGRLLARGEADLDQLMQEDQASVSELKLDRPAYAPGEVARIVIKLQSRSQHSYRLEVTARDGRGTILLRDHRKGASPNGQSSQEFILELPRELTGSIIFEYQVLSSRTGMLFDSGEREIPLTATGDGAHPADELRPAP